MVNLPTLSSGSQQQSDLSETETTILLKYFKNMKQFFDEAKIYDEAKIKKWCIMMQNC